MDEFTPKREESRGIVEIDVSDCPLCGKTMVKVAAVAPEPFPRYFRNTLEAQMERAGWKHAVYSGGTSRYVCAACVEEYKESFTCVLCKKELPLKLSKESFGDPPVNLCVRCYESVPAKTWDDKCEELREAHRYDFE